MIRKPTALNVSTQELAHIFDVTTKAVRGWVSEGLPVRREGNRGAGNSAEFDVATAVRWYLKTRAGALDLNAERAALARVQREKMELELAERAGELVEIGPVVDGFSQEVLNARNKLLALPKRLAPSLAPISDVNVIAQTIYDEMCVILTELADGIGKEGQRLRKPKRAKQF